MLSTRIYSWHWNILLSPLILRYLNIVYWYSLSSPLSSFFRRLQENKLPLLGTIVKCSVKLSMCSWTLTGIHVLFLFNRTPFRQIDNHFYNLWSFNSKHEVSAWLTINTFAIRESCSIGCHAADRSVTFIDCTLNLWTFIISGLLR